MDGKVLQSCVKDSGDTIKQQTNREAMVPYEVVERLQRLRRRLKKEEYAPLLESLQSMQVKRQEKDVKAVEALRGQLRMKGLLPPELDDFDNLLR